jgi:HAD superfamily phosphoserine phosphatase-like hydrolase
MRNGATMSKPKVFISSTYVDLQEVRSALGNFFNEIGFDTKLFERGGVFYDPDIALDQSGYREIKDCDLFVLIIGGRYGSQSSELAKSSLYDYNSVTKTEYLMARNAGIPIYTFVRTEVHTELGTYRKLPQHIKNTVPYAYVDNIQIFKLIEEIYAMKKGNPIFTYATSDDIIQNLKAQLAGMWSEYLKVRKHNGAIDNRVRINAYKLFFLRSQENMTLREFSKKTGVDRDLLWKLEKVEKKSEYLDPRIFSWCDIDVVEKIEKALNCVNYLRVGRADDFLSIYIQYYYTYKKRKKTELRPESVQLSLFPTKAVVLDFDGTMTSRKEDITTWEKIWVSLGYDINDCSKYHRQYSEGKLSHSQWCDITRDKFRQKGLRESQLLDVAKTIELIPGCREVLNLLQSHNIKLYIVSGSIRQIIKNVLGKMYELFDEVKANELTFDSDGRLSKIKGTKYDFEGKADFIKAVIQDNGFSPLEVLFIGNSCNDVWASQSGAKTLCVNPRFTDPNNVEHWTYCLRKMYDLRTIMEFVALPSLTTKNNS